MHKILEQAKKEIKDIEEKGLNANNLQAAGELIDIVKDIYKIDKCEEEMERRYDRGYEKYGRYPQGDYYRGYDDRYGDYTYGGYRGTYGGYDDRRGRWSNAVEKPFEYMMEDIEDGVVTYHEGRGRMRYGAADDRALDGLEKMMRGISAMVEATMNMANTDQEKEIIKKHLQKIKSM